MEEDRLYCPNCGSSQLVANKKGFGAGKAVAGALLTGGIGLLAGFIGSGDVKVTCLKCGKEWGPSDLRTTPLTEEEKEKNKEDNETVEGCAWAITIFIAIAFALFCLAMCS